MTTEEQLVGKLTEGLLDEEEADALAAACREDPNLPERIMHELDLANLMSLELNPERSDDAFMETFAARLKSETEEGLEKDGNIVEFPNRHDEEEEREKDVEEIEPPLPDRQKRSRFIRLALPIAASLVICTGLIWQFALRPVELSGSIASIHEPGKGFEVHRGKTVMSPSKDMPLQSGDLIVSSQANQSLAFKFSDGSKVALSKRGSIRVEEYRRKGKLLSLQSGKAAFAVTQQENPFRVTTQHGTVSVVGTAFAVTTSDAVMELNVAEGVVEIANLAQEKVLLHAGESAWASAGDVKIRRTPQRVELVPSDDATLAFGPKSQFRKFGERATLEVRGKLRKHNPHTITFALKFELEALPETLEKATLRLHCDRIMDGEMPPIHVYHAIKDDWQDRTVTGHNGPHPDVDLGTLPATTGYHEFDLTELVRAERAGDGILTLCVKALPGSEKKARAIFSSKEAPDETKWPRLIIEASPTEAP